MSTHQSEQINELASALAKAQSKIRNAEEDKSNPHFKSKYATLSSIWDACRGPLTENGLSVVQIPIESGGKFYLETMLIHSSGQYLKSTFPINVGLKIQETGSQITYARRYALSSIAGVAPGEVLDDDDDGEASMGRGKSSRKTAEQKLDSKIQEFPKVQPVIKGEEVSKEEVDELLGLINQCGDEYKANFYELIKGRDLETAYDMGRSLFNGLKKSALVKVAQMKKIELEANAGPFNEMAL
jgi:hypothetical protein